MDEANNLDYLRQSRASRKALPGRSAQKAQTEKTVQTISVEQAKNGEVFDFGAMLGEGEKTATIKQRYMGGKPVQTAKASQNKKADLPLDEQIEQLQTIRKSAIEYESFFVNHLVKQMRQSPLAKTPGGDTFSDIAEQPFRDFLSLAGGFGLADSIVQQVARQEGLEQTLHQHPGIMGPDWRPDVSASLVRKFTGQLGLAPENQGLQAEKPATEPAPEAAEEPGRAVGGAAKKSDSDQVATRRAGLMNDEEITWLYREAAESLA